jgi:hypothetical protein
MKILSLHRLHLRASRQGMAIILTLAAVVLMSGLVLAFFTLATRQRTLSFSSVNQMKADALARQAAQAVTAHFQDELASSSDIYDRLGVQDGTNGSPYLYLPKTRKNMLPEKVAPANAPVTLLKLLEKDDGGGPAISSFYTGGPILTSGVGAYDRSLNGRSLERSYWTGKKRGPQMEELPPNIDGPGWHLVTRGRGTQAFRVWTNTLKERTSPEQVIGRYCFIAYDIGGLININQAGHPSQFSDGTTLNSAEKARKGTLAFLELSKLPGLASVPPAQLAKLDAFLEWRDPFTFASKTNFLDADLLADFRAFNGPLAVPLGANTLFSRGDLIRYARQKGLEDVLPHVTTFNRQSNQPTWSPTNPLPADITSPEINLPFDYETQAKASRSDALARRVIQTRNAGDPSGNNVIAPITNRHSAQARWPNDATLTTWSWNATTNQLVTYPVKAGDPIVLRRFPLSKIALFEKYRNATGTDKQRYQREILAAFGLIPQLNLSGSTLEPHVEWVYAYPAFSGTFSASANTIMTRLMSVDELANVGNPTGVTYGINNAAFNLTLNGQNTRFNREPNFFEILAMGILESEMGEGTTNTAISDATIRQRAAQTEDLRLSAAMALRIGANIIDQYDSDSYPTIIAFTRNPTLAASSYTPSAGDANYLQVIAGQESLPGVSEVFFRNFRKTGASNYKSWFEFELWNPHQNAGNLPSGADAPANFRVVATAGTVSTGARYANKAGINNDLLGLRSDQNESNYSSAYASSEQNTPHQIRFSYPGSSSFRDPTILRTNLASVTNNNTLGVEGSGSYQNIICGIYAGETVNAPHIAPAPTGAATLLSSYPYLDSNSDAPVPPNIPARVQQSITYWASLGSAPTFELQYQDSRTGANNRWVPLQAVAITRENRNNLMSGFLTNSQDQVTAKPQTLYEPSILPKYLGSNSTSPDISTETFTQSSSILYGGHKIDPRMTRPVDLLHGMATPESGIRPQADATKRGIQFLERPSSSSYGGKIVNTILSGMSYRLAGDFLDNRVNWLNNNVGTEGSYILFFGRDGVLRPGDGWMQENSHPGMNIQGSYYANGILSKSSYGNSWLDHRPYFLNQPYRSVGELAYVFRDKPWKSINFHDPTSAEAGLLDLFCVQETPINRPYTAGGMNLNSMPEEVISALLQGTGRNPPDNSNGPASLDKGTADALAAELRAFLDSTDADKGLFLSRSDLVTRFGRTIQTTANTRHPAAKIHREVLARSLGEVGDVSTWNLLIDLTAQTGRYSPSATKLSEFNVEGEQRYWLHLAINRFTGKVVDQLLEPALD